MQTRIIPGIMFFASLLTTCGLVSITVAQESPNFYHPPLSPVAGEPGGDPTGGAFAAPVPDEPAVQPMDPPKIRPDGRITLALEDGSRLVGKPVDLETLTFKSNFGKVSVPTKSVAGIHFAKMGVKRNGHKDVDLLLFLNNDSLSGHLELESITIEAAWGEVTVPTDQLESIVNGIKPHVWVFRDHWTLTPKRNTKTRWPGMHAGIVTPDGVQWDPDPNAPRLVPGIPQP